MSLAPEHDRIAIAMICDENYVVPTLVAIASIIENKKEDTQLDFFVITTGLSQNNKQLFLSMSLESVRINVIEESIDDLLSLHTYDENAPCVATPAALLKFRLPEIVTSYDKLLYLDGDVIVREDLSVLFGYDIADYYLAAVVDSGSIYYKHSCVMQVRDYFNSGVMLLNLKKMREEKCSAALISAKHETNDNFLMDQNIFNIVFDGNVLLLPIRYNVLYVNLIRAISLFTIGQINERYSTEYPTLNDLEKDASIIHYSSIDKPWKSASVPLAAEWYNYYLLAKSRFPDIHKNVKDHKELAFEARLSNPKVSVIIPAYNVEKYIIESMDSITNQTFSDIQIIVVDDGSSDRTLEILNSYSQKDNRITVISQNNQGQSIARNVGFSVAQGEYVYFFDSDDILLLNSLEILYNHAQYTDSQIVLFDGISFYESKTLEESFPQYKGLYERRNNYHGIYKGDNLYILMVKNGDYQVQPCLQFFKRQYLLDNDLHFREGIIHEDNIFSFQALVLCQRASHLRLNLFHRRIREGSTMTVAFDYKHYSGIYSCIVELLKFLVLQQNKISDIAIITAKRHLLSFFNNIYQKQYLLPFSQQNQPQFLDPILHVLSEIIYLPFACRKEEESKRVSDIQELQFTLQSAIEKNLNLQDEIDFLTEKIRTMEYESNCLQNSKSFIVGRVLTFIPRKTRGLTRHIRANGFSRTVLYAVSLVMHLFKTQHSP